jgi:hypothetical protein
MRPGSNDCEPSRDRIDAGVASYNGTTREPPCSSYERKLSGSERDAHVISIAETAWPHHERCDEQKRAGRYRDHASDTQDKLKCLTHAGDYTGYDTNGLRESCRRLRSVDFKS